MGEPSTLPPASDRVRRSWVHRVEVEYATGACASQLAWWLMQIGASPDLVLAANQVVAEELDHAARSFEICQLAGVEAARPIARESLALPRDPEVPLEHDLIRGCMRVFCLGEAYAVEMLRATRGGCTVPVVRELVDRLLADELGHKAFGFEVLGWVLDGDESGALAAVARAEYPKLVASLRESFGVEIGAGPKADELDEADRAWGVVTRQAYADGLERVLRTLPGQLSAIGLELDESATANA